MTDFDTIHDRIEALVQDKRCPLVIARELYQAVCSAGASARALSMTDAAEAWDDCARRVESIIRTGAPPKEPHPSNPPPPSDGDPPRE